MEKVTTIIEHIAIKVYDMEWYLNFFTDALGLSVREIRGEAEKPEQIWVDYIQLTRDADPAVDKADCGIMWHIGVFSSDLEKTLEKVYAYPQVKEMPQGRNWFVLPNGLGIEVIQASKGSAEKIKEVNLRA